MAVFVDNMEAAFGRMVMCHMVADTHEELVLMADTIGVQRKWIQKAGTRWEHFDISKVKRRAAVQNGAIEITLFQLGRKCRSRPAFTAALEEAQKRNNDEGSCEI